MHDTAAAIPAESSFTRPFRTPKLNADCVKMLVATLHQIGQSQMFQANTKFLMVACSILQDLMAKLSTLRTFEKIYLSRTAPYKPGYFHRVDPSPRSVECTANGPHLQENEQ
jgi:hypothetical protein